MPRTARVISLVLLSVAAAPLAAAQPAPASIDRAVEAIAKIGAAFSPTWSPDDRQVAFVSRLSGLPQVWVVAAEGGAPLQVTWLTDPVQSVHCSPPATG